MSKKKFTHEELAGILAECENAKRKIVELNVTVEKLRKSENKYRCLVESVQDRHVIYRHDMEGNFEYLSPSITDVLGYTQEEFMGHYSEYMTDNPLNKNAKKFTDIALNGEKQRTYEVEYWHKNGSRVWLNATELPVFDKNGNMQGIEGIVQNITERKELEISLHDTLAELKNTNKELANKKAFVESIFSSMADGVWVVDQTCRTIDANNSMVEMLGYKSLENFLKIAPLDVIPEENRERASEHIRSILEGKVVPLVDELIKKNKTKLPVSITASPLKDSQKNIIGALAIMRDITEIKIAEERSFLDKLTGFVNRNPFEKLLEQTLVESEKRNEKCALLFLSLKINMRNHSIEHLIKDKLIAKSAVKIRNLVEYPNLLCRYGELEFAVCVKNVKSITAVLELSKKMNFTLSKEISLDKIKYDINSSIGISFYPKDGKNIDELIKSSIIAMSNAHKKGKNKSCLYNLKYKQSLDFNYSLEKAYKNNEFMLYYQPIVDSRGRCVFIEALIRWNSPTYGLVSPLQFIELLEKNQQIIEVGLSIIEESALTIKKINSIKGFENIAVSINVSITQLLQKNFYTRVKEILDEIGVNYQNINFEITETKDPYYNYSYIIQVLERIKELGIGILLDDFGTGFSSLVNIIKFPIDIIKLDRFFLNVIKDDSAFKPILSGVFYTAKETDKKIVAEGIESYSHFTTLKKNKCNYYQGFFFSKPIPNIIEVLKKTEGNFMPKEYVCKG